MASLSAFFRPSGYSAVQASNPLATDVETNASVFTLCCIFQKWIQIADKMLDSVLKSPIDKPFILEDVLVEAKGGDFCRLVCAIAELGRHDCPSVISSAFEWHSSKKIEWSSVLQKYFMDAYPKIPNKEIIATVNDRMMYSCDFLMSRMLVALLASISDASMVPEDIATKIENFAFQKLTSGEVSNDHSLRFSRDAEALRKIYGRLLGALSGIRFVVITEKFISIVEAKKLKEGVLESLVRSMRFLKLRLYPMDAFEETISFLKACAENFQQAPFRIRLGFSEILIDWLLPIAAVIDAEVNVPAWMKNVELIYPKAFKMLSKPKYQAIAAPLVAALLCVSNQSFFLDNWQKYFDVIVRLFKDKYMRQVCFISVVRVLWTYIFRHETSEANATRVIESISSLCFPYGRRAIYPSDVPIDYFVEFVYYGGMRQSDFAVQNVIFSMLIPPATLTSMDAIAPERTMIALRAFLKMIAGIVDQRSRADFPSFASHHKQWPADDLISIVVTPDSSASTSNHSIADGSSMGSFSDTHHLLSLGMSSSSNNNNSSGLNNSSSNNSSHSNSNILGSGLHNNNNNSSSNALYNMGSLHASLRPHSSSNNNLQGSALGSSTIPSTTTTSHSTHAAATATSTTGMSTSTTGSSSSSKYTDASLPMSSSVASSLFAIPVGTYENSLLTRQLLTARGLITYMDQMNQAIGECLRHLSGLIHNYTYRSLQDSKSMTALMRTLNEKQPYIELLVTIMHCMPRLFPAAWTDLQLADLLAHGTLHLDRALQRACFQCAVRITAQCPSLRLCLLQRLVRAFAAVPPHRIPAMALDLLALLSQLLLTWTEFLEAPLEEDRSPRLPERNNPQTTVNAARAFSRAKKPRAMSYASTLLSYAPSSVSVASTWTASSTATRTPHTLREQLSVLCDIEGYAVTLLCSALPSLRGRVFDLLTACDTLLKRLHALEESSNNSGTALCTVLDVMSECSHELIRKHYVDRESLTSKTETFVKKGMTLRTLAESTLQYEQPIWSLCLGDLVRILHRRCPRSLCRTWPEVVERLDDVQTLVESAVQAEFGPSLTALGAFGGGSRQEPLSEDTLYRWRNYLTFACAIAHAPASHAVAKQQQGGMDREMLSLSPETGSLKSMGMHAAAMMTEPSSSAAANVEANELSWPRRTASHLTAGERMHWQNNNNNHSSLTEQSLQGAASLVLPQTVTVSSPTAARLNDADALFRAAIRLLKSDHSHVRTSVISSLRLVHPSVYRLLVAEIQAFIQLMKEALASSSRSRANKYKKRADRIRLDLSEMMANTAELIFHPSVETATNTANCLLSDTEERSPLEDEVLVRAVVDYIMETKVYLAESAAQLIWELPMLRYYYCRLVYFFYDAASRHPAWSHYLPAELRASLFYFFDEWSGGIATGGTDETVARHSLESKFYLTMLHKGGGATEESSSSAAAAASHTAPHLPLRHSVEEQLVLLETQALASMSALCQGTLYASPLSVTIYPKDQRYLGKDRWLFDLDPLLVWFDHLFMKQDETLFQTARAAIRAMLLYNGDHPEMMERVVNKCFSLHAKPKASNGFFLALVDALTEDLQQSPRDEGIANQREDAQKSAGNEQKPVEEEEEEEKNKEGEGGEQEKEEKDSDADTELGLSSVMDDDRRDPSLRIHDPLRNNKRHDHGDALIERMGDSHHRPTEEDLQRARLPARRYSLPATGLPSRTATTILEENRNHHDNSHSFLHEGEKTRRKGITTRTSSMQRQAPWRFAVDPAVLVALILYKMPDFSHVVRQSAVKLLATVESHFCMRQRVNAHEIVMSACLPMSYTMLRDNLYVRMADVHHQRAHHVFSEIVRRFDVIGGDSQRHLLNVLYPWMSSIDLVMDKKRLSSHSDHHARGQRSGSSSSSDESGTENAVLMEQSYAFLVNLFYLTTRYDSAFPDELEALWGGLVEHSASNLHAILLFMIQLVIAKRHPLSITIAKKIVSYLGRIESRREALISDLIHRMDALHTRHHLKHPLQHFQRMMSAMDNDALLRRRSSASLSTSAPLFVANIHGILPDCPHNSPITVGELGFLLMVNLVLELSDFVYPHLPLLLHMAFVQMDHMNLLVCDHARTLLIHLIHAMILQEDTDISTGASDPLSMEAYAMIAELASAAGRRLWNNEDMRADHQQVKDPRELKASLYRVLAIFGQHNDLAQQWGQLALSWAVGCPMRHVASRSLQIYAAIMPEMGDEDPIAALFLRISDTVADPHLDVQAFVLEEISTLRAMVGAMTPALLLSYSEMFWGTVALLLTHVEYEYLHALQLLSQLLAALHVVHPELLQESTTAALLRDCPTQLPAPFLGLQPLLLKGLLARSTDTQALSMLVQLTGCRCTALVDATGARVLWTLLAVLPRMLAALPAFMATQGERHFTAASRGSDGSSSLGGIAIHPGNTSVSRDTDAPVAIPQGVVVSEEQQILSLMTNVMALLEGTDASASLCRLLQSYVKRRVRSEEEFVRQLCGELASLYFPRCEMDAVLFVLEMIKFGPVHSRPYYRVLLKELIPCLSLGPTQLLAWRSALLLPLQQMSLSAHPDWRACCPTRMAHTRQGESSVAEDNQQRLGACALQPPSAKGKAVREEARKRPALSLNPPSLWHLFAKTDAVSLLHEVLISAQRCASRTTKDKVHALGLPSQDAYGRLLDTPGLLTTSIWNSQDLNTRLTRETIAQTVVFCLAQRGSGSVVLRQQQQLPGWLPWSPMTKTHRSSPSLRVTQDIDPCRCLEADKESDCQKGEGEEEGEEVEGEEREEEEDMDMDEDMDEEEDEDEEFILRGRPQSALGGITENDVVRRSLLERLSESEDPRMVSQRFSVPPSALMTPLSRRSSMRDLKEAREDRLLQKEQPQQQHAHTSSSASSSLRLRSGSVIESSLLSSPYGRSLLLSPSPSSAESPRRASQASLLPTSASTMSVEMHARRWPLEEDNDGNNNSNSSHEMGDCVEHTGRLMAMDGTHGSTRVFVNDTRAVLRVLMTLPLALSYSEVQSLVHFRERFESELARVLQLADAAAVSVLRMEEDARGTGSEQAFTWITCELLSPGVRYESSPRKPSTVFSSVVPYVRLIEHLTQALANTHKSPLRCGKLTCRLLNSHRSKFILETPQGRLLYVPSRWLEAGGRGGSSGGLPWQQTATTSMAGSGDELSSGGFPLTTVSSVSSMVSSTTSTSSASLHSGVGGGTVSTAMTGSSTNSIPCATSITPPKVRQAKSLDSRLPMTVNSIVKSPHGQGTAHSGGRSHSGGTAWLSGTSPVVAQGGVSSSSSNSSNSSLVGEDRGRALLHPSGATTPSRRHARNKSVSGWDPREMANSSGSDVYTEEQQQQQQYVFEQSVVMESRWPEFVAGSQQRMRPMTNHTLYFFGLSMDVIQACTEEAIAMVKQLSRLSSKTKGSVDQVEVSGDPHVSELEGDIALCAQVMRPPWEASWEELKNVQYMETVILDNLKNDRNSFDALLEHVHGKTYLFDRQLEAFCSDRNAIREKFSEWRTPNSSDYHPLVSMMDRLVLQLARLTHLAAKTMQYLEDALDYYNANHKDNMRTLEFIVAKYTRMQNDLGTIARRYSRSETREQKNDNK